jgi:hypothetical protein
MGGSRASLPELVGEYGPVVHGAFRQGMLNNVKRMLINVKTRRVCGGLTGSAIWFDLTRTLFR